MANHVLFMYSTVAWGTQWATWDGPYGDEMFGVVNARFPRWLNWVNFYLQFFILIGSPLLAVSFGWRIRKNPPRDRLNLPHGIDEAPLAHRGARRLEAEEGEPQRTDSVVTIPFQANITIAHL
jgi:hypothetical protein